MLENPLIRFLGSAIALASLPAIEFFGSVEQQGHGFTSVPSVHSFGSMYLSLVILINEQIDKTFSGIKT